MWNTAALAVISSSLQLTSLQVVLQPAFKSAVVFLPRQHELKSKSEDNKRWNELEALCLISFLVPIAPLPLPEDNETTCGNHKVKGWDSQCVKLEAGSISTKGRRHENGVKPIWVCAVRSRPLKPPVGTNLSKCVRSYGINHVNLGGMLRFRSIVVVTLRSSPFIFHTFILKTQHFARWGAKREINN